MLKIFAMLAFGVASASAAPSLDTMLPPFDLSAPLTVVLANSDDETQAQSTDSGRSEGAWEATSSKQSRLKTASEYETGGGFCECVDERARVHCLIYMNLREDGS